MKAFNYRRQSLVHVWIFTLTGLFLLVAPLELVAQPPEKYLFTLEKEPPHSYPIENLPYLVLKEHKVALVLSGGGARGLIHIGVLRALEAHNIPIDLIVGTSIGSIVGGFYAAGYSADQIQRIVAGINWNSIFIDSAYRNQLFWSQKNIPRRHILQFRFDGLLPYIPSSISQGQRIFQTFYNQLLQANFQAANNFNHLRIPFRAVATDLVSGERVVLDRGDLAEAMNASMAFPLLFAPVEVNGRLLIDGGVTDNLPVGVSLESGADYVIAVDATSSLRNAEEIGAPWEIADQVTSIMMMLPTDESRESADIVIRPPLEEYKGGDYRAADIIIERGYQKTIDLIDSIRTGITKKWHTLGGENRQIGTLADLSFTGTTTADQRDATSPSALLCQPGRAVSEADLYADLRTIFREGNWVDVRAVVSGPEDAREIVFELEEYPLINKLKFHHQHALDDSLFLVNERKFNSKRLNIKGFRECLRDIKNEYVRKGFFAADIQRISYDPASGNLDVYINEGVINEVEIVGNESTRSNVILRELPFTTGEALTAGIATNSIENIYSTNLFDRVLINLERGKVNNKLIVKVKERRYFLSRLGAHYSSERNTEGFLELLQDNLFGTGVKLSTLGVVGDLARRAEAHFYTVRLFRTYMTARLSLYYKERTDRYYENFVNLTDYQVIRRGGKLILGQQIDRLGLISAELRAENVSVSSLDPGFRYRDKYRIHSLAVRSVVDKRDKLPFPDRGIYNRWYWEAGNQTFLGSSVPFTKIFLGLEGYYPFWHLNYHPFLFVGSADLTMPFSEYFHLGGQDNFPGLREREKLGRQYVNTGMELRYRVRWGLPIEAFLSARYSIGAIWDRPDDRIETDDFFHQVSASISMNSLLGPLRFTYGNFSGDKDRYYFTFGFDF